MVSVCRLALVLACLGLLASCSDSGSEKDGFYDAEFFVFGTRVLVTLADVDEETADLAFTHLQSRFQDWHRDWHAWEPGKLTQINDALAQGQSIAVDTELAELIRLSQYAENSSQGRFNPTIGRLIGLWGFHTSNYPISGPAPAAADIADLVRLNPSTSDLTWSEEKLSSSNPAVQFDFGGIGKGYAVDLACRIIKSLGVANAIVNAGGDLRAFGLHGDRPWRVAVENPLGGVLGGLEIRQDEAVFTSGNYARYRETDNQQRYPHILDPTTGWPASNVMSVTVVAEEGWLADAAATAIIVAGISGWSEVATELDVNQVLITDEQGRIYATQEMLARMEFSADVQATLLK